MPCSGIFTGRMLVPNLYFDGLFQRRRTLEALKNYKWINLEDEHWSAVGENAKSWKDKLYLAYHTTYKTWNLVISNPYFCAASVSKEILQENVGSRPDAPKIIFCK